MSVAMLTYETPMALRAEEQVHSARLGTLRGSMSVRLSLPEQRAIRHTIDNPCPDTFAVVAELPVVPANDRRDALTLRDVVAYNPDADLTNKCALEIIASIDSSHRWGIRAAAGSAAPAPASTPGERPMSESTQVEMITTEPYVRTPPPFRH